LTDFLISVKNNKMQNMMKKDGIPGNNDTENKNGADIGRRNVLKGMATVPVLGAFAYFAYKKFQFDRKKTAQKVGRELGLTTDSIQGLPLTDPDSKVINIGLVGYGVRGKELAEGLGFAHPVRVDEMIAGTHEEYTYDRFVSQEDLKVKITAVCDIYDTYGKMAQEAASNVNRVGSGGSLGEQVKRYSTYREMMNDPDIDAVIIASPDHWHAPMVIEAARKGKHIYCEKPMTWSVEETYEVRKAVKESGVVFQLGHQDRQGDSFIKAREAFQKGIIGDINLVEITLNRNSPGGAWVYNIPEDASPETIDWQQFIGQAPWHDFSPERFFRWRCWWDYGTGLWGDMLTLEYDALNNILDLGIPSSAASSGGIYFFRDGRTVPDVLVTQYEYPDRKLSLMYSATLASYMQRGKKIMGHDGYMDVGFNTLLIYADPQSTKYAEKIKNGEIDSTKPVYAFVVGIEGSNIDAFSSATPLLATKGLMHMKRNGVTVDKTHLHLKEWINCVRTGSKPSCDIDRGFEESITAHMGSLSYRNKKQVFWDAANEKVII
jgi:predicted dehydrogenase